MLGGFVPARGRQRSGLTPARGKKGSSSSLGGLVDINWSISREQSSEDPRRKVRAWLGSGPNLHSEGSSAMSCHAAHSASTGSLPLLLGDAGAESGV